MANATSSTVIVDRDETVVLDHAGYGDEYAVLWRYDIRRGRADRLPLFPTGFRMYPGTDGRSVLVGESTDGGHRFTVRPIADIERVVCEAHHDGRRWTFAGDRTPWSTVPGYVVVEPPAPGQWSTLLHLDEDDPDPDPLAWYRTGPYDHGWQGLLDAHELPHEALLVIAVQRDSNPVVYDPATRTVVDRLRLADRGGNPSLYFRRHTSELWVDDYDTVLRLDPASRRTLDSRRLQGDDGTGGRQFVGSFSLPWDERACVVARPFSGDVVVVDTVTFDVVGRVRLGDQPIDAVLLGDGRVVARDWDTGRLLVGTWP